MPSETRVSGRRHSGERSSPSFHRQYFSGIGLDSANSGGIIGANRMVDEATARAIRPGFFEAIVAPGYTPEALASVVAQVGPDAAQAILGDNVRAFLGLVS